MSHDHAMNCEHGTSYHPGQSEPGCGIPVATGDFRECRAGGTYAVRQTTPTPAAMAREAFAASDDLRERERLSECRTLYAAGITLERTRLSAALRARISVLRASPILSEEVDGAVAALEQVLAELGAG